MSWPKERAPLTDEQSAIMEDWIREFLTTVKSTRFGWVSRFDHTFPARSASSELRTLEIGAGTGSHVQFEPSGEYVALEASDKLAAQIPQRDGLSVVIADCEQRLPWDDDSFDRVVAIHVLEHLYNLPAALEEVARVLRPGGVFCVVIPCEGGRPLLAGTTLYHQTDFREALRDALRVDDQPGSLQHRSRGAGRIAPSLPSASPKILPFESAYARSELGYRSRAVAGHF